MRKEKGPDLSARPRHRAGKGEETRHNGSIRPRAPEGARAAKQGELASVEGDTHSSGALLSPDGSLQVKDDLFIVRVQQRVRGRRARRDPGSLGVHAAHAVIGLL